MTDLERAYEVLVAKAQPYDRLWEYYDGLAPLQYSHERLREVFHGKNVRFTQNWCAVVVDSVMDRINLRGFSIPNNIEIEASLNKLFEATELNLDSDDAHLASLVCGEAFILVWKNDGDEVEAFYNDPRLCHIEYDPDNPRRKLWAAKWWTVTDGTLRLVLYYADRLEYYRTTQTAENVSTADAFIPDDPPIAENPFGEVPVFHLRRSRRDISSELGNARPPQDAINKLLADMMVSAEFGAFRQRWIISNADLSALKNSPNEIWSIPAAVAGVTQPSEVGEFGETALTNYLSAIDDLSRSLAIITRTPKHYFFSSGSDLSGEALRVMESPLVKKCERYIERFTPVWRRIAAFLLKLQGTDIDPLDIVPMWDEVETPQKMLEAQAVLLRKEAGISRSQALRELGYTEEQITEMSAERDEEQASLGEQLLTAFEQGQGE